MDTKEKAEESKIRTDAQEMYYMTKSEGWRVARQLLENKIIDIQSVRNLNVDNADGLVVDIKARNAAIDIIMGWLREIEGGAEKHKDAIDDKIEEASYVRKYE